MAKNELPPGTEAGYLYDYNRQSQSKREEDKKKYVRLKKKIDKLSKKNKNLKRK